MGDFYFSFKKYEKSQFFYSKSYELTDLKYINNRSLNQFLIVLYKTGKYERFNSLVINKNITLNKTNSLEIASLIEKNTFAFNSQKDSILFNPKSLSINSNSDQYFPSMPINSNVIIFTQRDRVDDFVDENFFLSRKVNNVWTKPIKLGDNINSDYREGSLSVSFDGRDLFFTSCNRPDTYGGCDLYFSTLINDTVWSESINMGTSLNTKYWESQPSISADGQLLFFSSDRVTPA